MKPLIMRIPVDESDLPDIDTDQLTALIEQAYEEGYKDGRRDMNVPYIYPLPYPYPRPNPYITWTCSGDTITTSFT